MAIANNIDAFQFSDPIITNGDLASLATDAIEYGAGGGSSVTYLMRGWGTVSLRYVYWEASAPDGTGAPEVVTDPVLMKEIY